MKILASLNKILVFQKNVPFKILANGSTTTQIIVFSPPLRVGKYVKQSLLSYYCIATPVGLIAIYQSYSYSSN